MPDEKAARALEIAGEIDELVEKISTRLDNAARYARRTRLLTWLAGVFAVLAVAEGVTIGVVVADQRGVSSSIHANQIHACQIGNDARTRQRLLWAHVLQINSQPQPGETRAERQRRARTARAFLVFIRKTFRPVDCARLYRLRPGARAILGGVNPRTVRQPPP